MTVGARVMGDGLRRAVPFLFLAGVLVNAGCHVGDASPRLQDAAPSIEALAADVLDAFVRGDAARLERLALSEHEFRTLVWPRLPASRPEAGVPAEYAWSDLSTKSRGDLRQTLGRYRGGEFELVSVRFTGAVSDYGAYRVYRDSVLDVRAADGAAGRLRLFGSVIEHEGRVKVFSYVVD